MSTREAPWALGAWGFIWSWSHKHRLPGMSPQFQSPRWEVGVQHKPHCLFRQPRDRQLLISIGGVLGTLPSPGRRCQLRAAGLTALCRAAAPRSALCPRTPWLSSKVTVVSGASRGWAISPGPGSLCCFSALVSLTSRPSCAWFFFSLMCRAVATKRRGLGAATSQGHSCVHLPPCV